MIWRAGIFLAIAVVGVGLVATGRYWGVWLTGPFALALAFELNRIERGKQ
ncbi:MAG: hypothetical protein ACYDHP_00680 [Ferrimicrobium sp.]